MKEEIDDEIILDSEEVTEEDFQSADLIETDADLEAVIENIENEKDQAISENDIIDNSVLIVLTEMQRRTMPKTIIWK